MTDISPLSASSVTYTRCAGVPTTSNLAFQLGYFDQNLDGNASGIQLECAGGPTTPERYWLRHSSYANAIAERAAGADSYVIAMSWLEGSFPVFVRRQSPIRGAADLKGKRLGILRSPLVPFDVWRAQNLNTFRSALRSEGLDLSDASVVNIYRSPVDDARRKAPRRHLYSDVGRDLAVALVRDEADAIAANLTPDIADFLDLREIYNSRTDPSTLLRVNPSVLRCLVVSGPLLRERRDLVVAIVSRLLKAAEWARRQPDEAIRLLARDLNTSPEALLAVYENLSEGMQISATSDLIDTLDQQKSFLIAQRFLSQNFDIESWVDLTPLAEAQAVLSKEMAETRSVAG